MKFSTYFDRESYIKDSGTENTMESLTDQSFKFDADINELVLRYQNGLAPRTPVQPKYDMDNYETSNWTFEDWQNEKAMVERKFLHLSPEMRAYFVTPQRFLEYCSNPENYELLPTGMAEKQVVETPVTIPETLEQPVQAVEQPK